MVTSIRCVAHNDLWSWPISSRSLSHDFTIRLLKYVISCHVSPTTRTVLDGFFPCLAQMITSMRGYVAHNDVWPWPIFLRLFSCDAYLSHPGIPGVIKSLRYTGGDFMFLYRFVHCRRRRPQILIHAITFEQLFGFLSFLARLLALTCRLPD